MMNEQQDLEAINYKLQFQNNLFLKRIAELEAQLAERDALLTRIAELEKDAERYRWMRNNTSVMLFDNQTWVTSHKLDMRVDEAMKESE
jgi:hypothetical protein